MSTNRHTRLALFFSLALFLSIASISAYEHAKPTQRLNGAHAGSDNLDPNDCSRGIDEANQESCDAGGGQ